MMEEWINELIINNTPTGASTNPKNLDLNKFKLKFLKLEHSEFENLEFANSEF